MNLNPSQPSLLRARRPSKFHHSPLPLVAVVLLCAGGAFWADAARAATLNVLDGLVMRLESIDGVLADDSGFVSEWLDLTASGHGATQTADPARQPQLIAAAMPSGAAAVRFDGDNDLLTVSGQVLTSESFSIFAVVNATPTTSGHRNLFGNWSAAAGNTVSSMFVGITAYQSDTDSALVRFSDAIANAGRVSTLASHFILDFVTDNDPLPGAAAVAQNGFSIFSGAGLTGRNLTANPDNGPYTIGVQGDPNHGASAGEYWPGDIAAILVYDRALSASEQEEVRQYLRDTYLEPVAPTLVGVTPPVDAIIAGLTSITLVFDEAVQNVSLGDLLINGTARATSLVVVSPREYRFEFPAPPFGPVTVAFATGHGITDLASTPNAFAGGNWGYTLVQDLIPPTLAATVPTPNTTVSELRFITVTFDEPVTGVDAGDLLINGSALATGLLVGSASDYTFSFPEPAFGMVNVAFKTGHGITDQGARPNAFAGGSWTYTLDPNAPVTLAVTRGLAMRLEAGSGVTKDGAGLVSAWLDQSGNGHDASQANPDRQPLLVATATPTGAPALRFDGGDDLLTLAGQVVSSQDFSIFAVVNATPNSAGNKNLFGNWSAAAGNTVSSLFVGLAGYTTEGDQARVRFSDVFQNAGTVRNVATHFVLDFTTDSDPAPGVSEVAQNAAPIFTGGPLSPRTLTANELNGPYTIGVQGDPDHGVSAGEYWGGDIAAILVYDRALASAERSSVRQYLMETYVGGDTTAPTLVASDPPTGVTVRSFTSLTLLLSEDVQKVDRADLLINGVATVTEVVPISAREYTFRFPQPSSGPVTVTLAASHGITDVSHARNPLAGLTLNYTLDPNASYVLVTDGLAMRLEATTGVTADASGRVSLWADQTGNGHDAFQANPDRQPLLVPAATPAIAPALRFDGANDLLTLAGQVVSSQDFSIFAVVNAVPRDGGNKNLFGNWSAAAGNFGTSLFIGLAGYLPDTDSARVRFTDVFGSAGTAQNVKNHFILDFITDNDPGGPGSSTVAQNGRLIFSGEDLDALGGRNLTSNPDTAPYTIGVQGDPDHGVSAGEFWTGDIAALVIYDRTLSVSEQFTVRQYLTSTYLTAMRLTIQRVTLPGGPGVRVSWPRPEGAAFTLQSAPSLPSTAWVNLTATPVDNEFVYSEVMSGTKFFRLRRP